MSRLVNSFATTFIPSLILLGASTVAACQGSQGLAESRRLAGAPAEVAALPSGDSLLIREIDVLTRHLVAADSFSGVVVLARNGAPIYQFAAGVADRSTGAPPRLDTRFNLGSVDKFFTRIAIHQLQDAGLLSTSDLVGEHLPEYPNARVREEVTIAHLLDMRSGMGDFDSDPGYANYEANVLRLRSLDDYVALFAEDTLLFDPGTDFLYSNAGYVVLGKIVEAVSGQSYYDYVQRHVFDPAGMVGTGYFTVEEAVPNLAVGYTTSPAGEGEEEGGRRPNTTLLPYRGSSAGGGYSTAEDFLELSRALLAHRLLSPEGTYALLGERFRTPEPGAFDVAGWRGGSQGMNAVYLLFSTGHTLIALSNYDPPGANVISRRFMGAWLPAWMAASPGGAAEASQAP